MKLLHCADLHLDAALETNLPPTLATVFRNELLTSLKNTIDYAKANDVEAFLIAGDMFDSNHATVSTADYVISLIESAPKIEFYYISGNHDRLTHGFVDRILPKNLHLFADEWTSYSIGDVCITGINPTQENCTSMYASLALPADAVNVVMLHGQIGTISGEDFINLTTLKEKNIDYLALGHIHSYSQGQLDNRGIYCYSGCLSGRGFDECGSKGFVIIDVEKNKVTSRFVKLSQRELHTVNVDISGKESVTDILSALQEAVAGIPSRDMVKLVLIGEYTESTNKDMVFLRERLKDMFFFAKIKDESTLHIDIESYVNDMTLKGEFIRLVRSSNLSTEMQDKVISCGVKALTEGKVTV